MTSSVNIINVSCTENPLFVAIVFDGGNSASNNATGLGDVVQYQIPIGAKFAITLQQPGPFEWVYGVSGTDLTFGIFAGPSGGPCFIAPITKPSPACCPEKIIIPVLYTKAA